MDTDAHLTATAFRAASDIAQQELLEVLRRHAAALGGPLGQVHVLIELLGSVSTALIAEVPAAAPRVCEQLTQLALYVATSPSTPQ